MANSLALSGLSSGLDTQAVISQLMSIEKRPVQLMQQNQAKAQTVLDHLRTLNTKMSALQSAAKSLFSASGAFSLTPFAAKTATSSDSTKFTATADSTATPGSYNVNVTQLAAAQKSGGGAFTALSTSGTLTITEASTGNTTNVALTAGMDVNQVAGAINGANGSMNATVVNGALVVTAKNTGESYTFSDNVSGALVSDTGINPTLQAAASANLTVDGIAVTSKTNAVTNGPTGVTLNLTGIGSATLTVAQDTNAAASKIKDLVAKYNDIVNQIKDDTKYDPNTKTSGVLIGDSFVNSLQSQLNQMFTEVVDPTSPYPNASSVGISVQRDGTLAVDDTKLNAALTADPQAVAKLFGNEDGVTTTDAYGQTVKQNTLGSTTAGTVGDGIANRLSAFVDSMVSAYSQYNPSSSAGSRYSGGLLDRINSQQNIITDFSKRIDGYNNRLSLREQSLKNQFTAMETAISMLKSQQSHLQGALGGMGG